MFGMSDSISLQRAQLPRAAPRIHHLPPPVSSPSPPAGLLQLLLPLMLFNLVYEKERRLRTIMKVGARAPRPPMRGVARAVLAAARASRSISALLCEQLRHCPWQSPSQRASLP